MKRVKGCLNSKCSEYKKKYYKESDEYCVKCGTKLNYVCKNPKCFKQLPEDVQEKYCAVHLAEKQDKNDNRVDKALKVGGGILAGFAAIVGGVKTVADIVRKK